MRKSPCQSGKNHANRVQFSPESHVISQALDARVESHSIDAEGSIAV